MKKNLNGTRCDFKTVADAPIIKMFASSIAMGSTLKFIVLHLSP